MDIGLLIARVVVGLLFIGHGTQKLFGWFGGSGPEGTGGFLGSLGYRRSRTMAIVNGVAEAGGGALLAMGFLTPIGCAALIGVMLTAAVAAHRHNGLWNQDGGYELPLLNAAVASEIAFTGPGRWSLDHVLGWFGGDAVEGLWATALGLAVGALVLAATWRPLRATEGRPASEPGGTVKAA